jgi:acetyl esterase
MLLNYGAFGVPLSEEAVRRFGGPEFMLTAEEMAGFWNNYLNGPEDAANPLACPLIADLAGLPPAFLAIAECDILAEQNHAMADRLRAAGVAVEEVIYAGAAHSFLEAVSIAPLADRALAEASQWLRDIVAAP